MNLGEFRANCASRKGMPMNNSLCRGAYHPPPASTTLYLRPPPHFSLSLTLVISLSPCPLMPDSISPLLSVRTLHLSSLCLNRSLSLSVRPPISPSVPRSVLQPGVSPDRRTLREEGGKAGAMYSFIFLPPSVPPPPPTHLHSWRWLIFKNKP